MPQCRYIDLGQQCPQQGDDKRYGLCRDHFIEIWWTWKENVPGRARFQQAPNEFPGMLPAIARRDLRAVNAANWNFTVVSKVDDVYFEARSAPFVVEKMGRRVLQTLKLPVSANQRDFYFGRPSANGAQGHAYFRLTATGIDECFGFVTGMAGEDACGLPQIVAKSNQLAIDYTITNAQKNAICGMVSEWLFHSYDLNNRNCTECVKAACDAAGIWWPAYALPTISNQTGFFGLVQTPNNLYLALKLSEYKYEPKLAGSHTSAPHGYMGIYPTAITAMNIAAIVVIWGMSPGIAL